MKLGVSTSCLYPLETERAFERVARSGVKYTEIFFNAECELKQDFVDQLLAIQREYGIEVVSVHPTMSLAESFVFFSNYARRLSAGLDSYRRYGEIAAQLGAKYVIMHGGKPNRILNDEQYCERFLEIAAAVRQGGAALLQENVVNFRAGSIPFLKKMADCLGDEAAFCLDVKQSIRGGYSPFEAVAAIGKHIRHLHISDHTPLNDCLLPLRGGFDFSAFFQAVEQFGYSGAAMIEVYDNAYTDDSEIFDSCRRLQEACGFR